MLTCFLAHRQTDILLTEIKVIADLFVIEATLGQCIQTDRQTDISLTEIKVITDLFVIVIREIYVHVYTRMLVC